MTDSGDEPGGGSLWAGRFSTPPAAAAHALGRSLHFDMRLASVDVEASIAHVGALQRAGLLDASEAAALEEALVAVGGDIAAGRFAFHDADEDVHSAVERGVTERLGDLGAKLHAGRSRNDLVVTDMRLWMLAAERRIDDLVALLCETLIGRAREHAETVMPGTTHARFAQPVTLGHHLLAHTWALARDLDRLHDWSVRASVSALGAGATATSTLGLDFEATATHLGMQRAFSNSIDAVSDRDFVQEFLAVATICATHLSRLASDLARWTDESLGWASLDEAYSTGSSMMPQKRNPDTVELTRAKAARVAADFGAVTMLLQGLPLGYQRDLQEDKAPLFDAVAVFEASLGVLAGMLDTLDVDRARMREAADEGYTTATAVADALVRRGIPFRVAHHVVGSLVAQAEEAGVGLAEVPDSMIGLALGASGDEGAKALAADEAIGDTLRGAASVDGALATCDVIGGTAPVRVAAALRAARARLDDSTT